MIGKYVNYIPEPLALSTYYIIIFSAQTMLKSGSFMVTFVSVKMQKKTKKRFFLSLELCSFI